MLQTRDASLKPFCFISCHYFLLLTGIPRITKEEKKAGDFPLFNDPDKRFSTFNLKYSHDIFDRLSGLVEFNTALNEQLIKDTMAECVQRKRPLNH